MTEIEKMFENAGIEKIELDYPDNIDPFYPDFTEEKQLELIKRLSTKELKIRTNKQPYAVYIGILGQNECFYGLETLYFEESLAGLINYLWQDLTNQEKEEIRKILNEN